MALVSLIIFQVGFSLFLGIPNILYSGAHGAVVGLFALSGFIFMVIMAMFMRDFIIDTANTEE